MGLLVEYSIREGKAAAQVEAMRALIAGLKAEGTDGFSYTAYETSDPTRFVAVFEFEDDAAKRRFLESAAFAAYRDSAADRFTAPPAPTPVTRIASTLD